MVRPTVATPPSTPAPPVKPPPSPYKNQRQDELEALKQRGLAKLLNKHFTSVTKSIAEEKAAADAALKDLEQRKANTSDPYPTNYGELSPYDKLYLELQQKKSDCKRKERETLLLYQRYVNKFGSTGAVTVPSVPFVSPDSSRKAAPSDYSPRRPAPSKELVPQLATSIDKTIEEQVERGADRLPSSHTMGVDNSYQNVQASLEEQERAFARRMSAERGVDARYTPRGSKIPRANWQKLPGTASPNSKPPLDPNSMPAPPLLTETPISKDGAEVPAQNVPLEGSNITLPTVDPTIDTTNEKMGDSDESNDKSVVSGLTSVEVMSEAESRLIEYLKTETEAIRQMLEEDEITSTSSKNSKNTSYSSQVASQTDHAAKQAEQMLEEMKKILAESQAEADSMSASEKEHEPYKLETNNRNEVWMVYWDSIHEREYYHEVNSNIVQWERPVVDKHPPSSTDNLVPMSDFTKKSRSGPPRAAQQLTYEDVMPEVHPGGLGRSASTRRLKYRKQQRRRRRRRRIIIALTAAATVGAGIYYKEHVNKAVNHGMSNVHPHLPKSLQWENEKVAFLDALSDKVNGLLPESLQWESAREKAETAMAEKKAKEEAAKKAEEQARMEAERKAKEEAAKKAKLEEEAARKATEAALQTLEEPDKQSLAIVENKKNRPWACNIPFAYLLHRKCWRAAKETPIFDLKALVQAMMQ